METRVALCRRVAGHQHRLHLTIWDECELKRDLLEGPESFLHTPLGDIDSPQRTRGKEVEGRLLERRKTVLRGGTGFHMG